MKMRASCQRAVPSVLAFCLIVALSTASHALYQPRTLDDLVQESPLILTATVVAAKSRWSDKSSVIETTYSLAVDDCLRGSSPEDIEVLLPGGTVGSITDRTSMHLELEVGQHYLLMMKGREDRGQLSITGAALGIFARKVRTRDDSSQVLGDSAFSIALGRPYSDAKDGRVLGFEEFVERVRGLARSNNTVSNSESRRQAQETKTAAKDYRPNGRAAALPQEISTRVPGGLGLKAPPVQHGEARRNKTPSLPVNVDVGRQLPSGGSFSPSAFFFGFVRLPLVFEPLPASYWGAPHDESMMALWNVYSDIFRVRTPDATWSFGNGVSEIVGWPSDETMIQAFGAGWEPGVLGVTWVRQNGDNIVEADIALNPSYGWTLDPDTGSRAEDPRWSVQQTWLHELGHAFGLAHPFEYDDVWWDSVMNYGPKAARIARLFADDTLAVHQVYGATGERDGTISAYSTEDDPSTSHARYVPVRADRTRYQHGETLRVLSQFGAGPGAVQIENTGTVAFSNPRVSIYLTPERTNFDGASLIGSIPVNVTLPPAFITRVSNLAATVGFNVPPGIQWPLFWLDNGDELTFNNYAWLWFSAGAVRVEALPRLIVPTPEGEFFRQAISYEGVWPIRFRAERGSLYTFSLCDETNLPSGSSEFESVLEVVDSSGRLVASSDVCGSAARLSNWEPPQSERDYTLLVRGRNPFVRGAFEMVYASSLDNCPDQQNPDQMDFDGDGRGDACETGAVLADVDGSQRVDGFDLAQLARAFGLVSGDIGYDPAVDLDRNGIIDGEDLALLSAVFGQGA